MKEKCPTCGHETGYTCDTCKDTGRIGKVTNTPYSTGYTSIICPACLGNAGPILKNLAPLV